MNPGTCGDPRDPFNRGRLSYAILETVTWQTIHDFRLNGAREEEDAH